MENPFNNTPTVLLCDIVNGKVDVKELAQVELKLRGFDNNGTWVGFQKPPQWWVDLYCPDGNCFSDADPGL
jgi:hypothetical protein